jgi:hypothetical protein
VLLLFIGRWTSLTAKSLIFQLSFFVAYVQKTIFAMMVEQMKIIIRLESLLLAWQPFTICTEKPEDKE